jgi:hypothetical protein
VTRTRRPSTVIELAIVKWMQADERHPYLTFSQRHFLAERIAAALEENQPGHSEDTR